MSEPQGAKKKVPLRWIIATILLAVLGGYTLFFGQSVDEFGNVGRVSLADFLMILVAGFIIIFGITAIFTMFERVFKDQRAEEEAEFDVIKFIEEEKLAEIFI